MKRKLIYSALLALCMTFSSFGGEHSVENESQPTRKVFFLIGEVNQQSLTVLTTNDWDLSQIGTALDFYPKTGDSGRTGGLNLVYNATGEKGKLELSYRNNLFTEDLYPEGSDLSYAEIEEQYGDPYYFKSQHAEEENEIKASARLFVDNKKNYYVIMSSTLVNRNKRGAIAGDVQDFIHRNISPAKPKPIVNRDGNEFFARAGLGIGTKLSLLKSDYVNFYVVGEANIDAATELKEETFVELYGEVGVTLGVWRDSNQPMVRLNTFVDCKQFATNELETVYGAELTFNVKINRSLHMEIGTGYYVYDTRLDRTYVEADPGVSYNTSLFFRFLY